MLGTTLSNNKEQKKFPDRQLGKELNKRVQKSLGQEGETFHSTQDFLLS